MIEGSAVSQTDKKLISNLFSFTHFLQARTNWPKLKAGVCDILKTADIQVVHSETGPNQDACLEELLLMMRGVKMDIHRNQQRSQISEDQGTEIISKHMKREQAFRSMWNCGFASTPKHACYRLGPSPCCKNNEESCKKMADAIIDIAFSSIPSTPAPGKWTKLWEPLCFIGFTLWTRMLQPCFQKVVSGFSHNEGAIDPELDPALQSVLQWSKITGFLFSLVNSEMFFHVS